MLDITAPMCSVFLTNLLGLPTFTPSATIGDSIMYMYDDYMVTYNVTNEFGQQGQEVSEMLEKKLAKSYKKRNIVV